MCPTCGTSNPYQSSQDGSRELWQHEHNVAEHPTCSEETGHLPGQPHRWQECPTYK